MATTRKRSKREENEILWRALAAFVKYARPGDLRTSPADTTAAIVEVGERLYVTIASGRRQLAVFRVRPGPEGQLKRMRRPPREIRGEDD